MLLEEIKKQHGQTRRVKGRKLGEQNPKNPYKMKEFKAFLKLIKEDAPIRFVQIAQLLDVDPTTITEWNKHPLAQKTVRDKIEKAIKGMEKAGKDDWRMWQRKLKMLGVFPRKRKDVATGGDKIKIVLLRTIA